MHLEREKLVKSLHDWQQVRSWARLIREAEMLWHEEQKALRRLGALELAQLIKEIPPSYRRRINLWLIARPKFDREVEAMHNFDSILERISSF